MFWDDLEKQEFARKVLKAHVEKERLAHTYLFTGAEAQMQESVSLYLACLLNDGGFAESEDTDSAAARRILDRNHPDVKWLGEDEKERSLKIAQVRDIIGMASLKPYEGKWKVFIIAGAGRLTVEAQNALLKILEEPPGQTLFCLLVENRDHLLETIRSRSFEIRLKPQASGPADEGELPETFGKKRWEDFFEDFQGLPKDELYRLLDGLYAYFCALLRRAAETGRNAGHEPAWLEATDKIYETKNALDSNANQKLALTHLAVHMKRLIKNPQMLKVEV